MSNRRTLRATRTVLLGCAAILALSACQGTRERAEGEIASTSMQTTVAKQAYATQQGPTGPGNVRVRQTVWLGSEATTSGNGLPLPAAVESNDAITVSSTDPMSLAEIARRASMISGIEITGVGQLGLNRPGSSDLSDPNEDPRNISAIIDYTGPLSGLLDMISAKFGVSWEYRGGVVRIFDFDTRSFTLIAAPVKTEMENEVKSTINSGSGSSGSGDTGSESEQGNRGGVSTKATLDYWSRIEKDLAGLVPDGTQWSISPESGSVTVTARPQILERIEKYVKDQNARMTRQVAVSVTVLAIRKDESEGFSADMDIAFADASSGIGASLNAIAPGIATASTSLAGALTDGKFSGSQLLIRAISEKADASLVTSGSVTTMNNQPAPIQISQETSYVSGYESNSNDSSTIVTPEISTLTTGFSMAVLPRVLPNGKVALNYSVGMSSLDALEEIGDEFPVQTPEVSARGFQQNVMLRSGDTLILAGYERVDNSTSNNKNGLLSWALGGDRSASRSHERLVILITPVIIEDPADLAQMK